MKNEVTGQTKVPARSNFRTTNVFITNSSLKDLYAHHFLYLRHCVLPTFLPSFISVVALVMLSTNSVRSSGFEEINTVNTL